MSQRQQDLIAQWAFDTRPILGRFHLWLEDIEEDVSLGEDGERVSFVGGALERCLIMTAAATALGTRLFGRYGEGEGASKAELNRVKKDADAVSAYTMSESLWYLTRNLPENHAIMVCLGEGLMPKAGEAPEMGANPQIGFGRIYARPQVARFLDQRVQRLLNDADYGWPGFWAEVQQAGITVWGAAIDTLENTSRFAKGSPTGPMTVLHLFNQPLQLVAPYEGYVGMLVLPRAVREDAARRSILLSFHTPRSQVLEAIQRVYPEIPPERVHVWTLSGKSREKRLRELWEEWRQVGVHLVEDGWQLPGAGEAFTESGTYAPMFRVGPFEDAAGQRHLWLLDGYAASAEAIQGASLDPALEAYTALCPFSSAFRLSTMVERDVMCLDSESASFAKRLSRMAGEDVSNGLLDAYRESIRSARAAGIPLDRQPATIDDFMPLKDWRVLAVVGHMLEEPYSGLPGVEDLGDGIYRVTVRAATKRCLKDLRVTLRLMESFEESRMVFSPLLDRFYAGQDYRTRPVKISDSGRIRNELQTLCSEALEYLADGRVRVCFDRLDPAVLPADKQRLIREVLLWYQERHPIWFSWLEIAD